MKLRVMLGGTIALVSAAILAGRAGADAEKTPTIKDVMVKLHKGANSPLAQFQGALKAEEPAWEKIQDRSKDFVNLGAALAKNEPPGVDLKSWKKLSGAYFLRMSGRSTTRPRRTTGRRPRPPSGGSRPRGP